MNKIKVRIVGTRDECEGILSLLPDVKKCRKIDRSIQREKDPYNRIFGKAEFAYYVELKKRRQN